MNTILGMEPTQALAFAAIAIAFVILFGMRVKQAFFSKSQNDNSNDSE